MSGVLPLAGPDFPASPESFADSLRAGLAARDISARDIRAAGEWPRLAELAVDLSGAKFSRATRVPRAETEPQPGVSIARLAVVAAPLHFETVPLRLELRAQDAECAFARDAAREPVLQLTRTGGGSVAVEAQRADLEATLKTFAAAALAKQGAEVKSVRLELNGLGPCSLGFRAEVTAKAFLMTARVIVTGRLDVDEQLTLRVRELATSGDGMIANLAGAFLRPRFLEMEKRAISLAAFSFAGVKLHGVRLGGGDALRIEAQFGG